MRDTVGERRGLQRVQVVRELVADGVGLSRAVVPVVLPVGRRGRGVDRPVEEGDRVLAGDRRLAIDVGVVPQLEVREEDRREGDRDDGRGNENQLAASAGRKSYQTYHIQIVTSPPGVGTTV